MGLEKEQGYGGERAAKESRERGATASGESGGDSGVGD
jgi:hypothetical protein